MNGHCAISQPTIQMKKNKHNSNCFLVFLISLAKKEKYLPNKICTFLSWIVCFFLSLYIFMCVCKHIFSTCISLRYLNNLLPNEVLYCDFKIYLENREIVREKKHTQLFDFLFFSFFFVKLFILHNQSQRKDTEWHIQHSCTIHSVEILSIAFFFVRFHYKRIEFSRIPIRWSH